MVRIKNTRGGQLNLRSGVKLAPGLNEVDAEAWASCKEDKITRYYLDNQTIQVVPGSTVTVRSVPDGDAPQSEQRAEPGTKPEPMQQLLELEDWPKLKVREVIPLLAELDEPAKLKQLLVLDSRPTVRTAVEHRLSELRT